MLFWYNLLVEEFVMDFEIIDFHTHPFLEARDNSSAHRDIDPINVDMFAFDLERCGITRFAGSVICCRESASEAMYTSNRAAEELKEIYGDKYIPGIMIDANLIDESVAEIDRAALRGVKLIGELVPHAMKWSFSDASFRNILDYTNGKGYVYSMHTFDDIEPLVGLARDYKDTDFVLAHPGEKVRLLRHIEAMKKYDNIYLDLSGTGLFRFGMLKRLIEQVGAERILFGTDHPICNPAMYVAGVMHERISERDMSLIFSENAKRLLKI